MGKKRIYNTIIEHPGQKPVGKWHLCIVNETDENPLECYQERIISIAIVQFDKNLPHYTKLDLAVKHYKPFVEYSFFNVGEKYGESDKTKVEKADTIVKSIILIQNNKPYNLLEYLTEVASVPLVGQSVVLTDIATINRHLYHDQNEHNDDHFVTPDSSEFYNDNLDMDQQSQEFWDDMT